MVKTGATKKSCTGKDKNQPQAPTDKGRVTSSKTASSNLNETILEDDNMNASGSKKTPRKSPVNLQSAAKAAALGSSRPITREEYGLIISNLVTPELLAFIRAVGHNNLHSYGFQEVEMDFIEFWASTEPQEGHTMRTKIRSKVTTDRVNKLWLPGEGTKFRNFFTRLQAVGIDFNIDVAESFYFHNIVADKDDPMVGDNDQDENDEVVMDTHPAQAISNPASESTPRQTSESADVHVGVATADLGARPKDKQQHGSDSLVQALDLSESPQDPVDGNHG